MTISSNPGEPDLSALRINRTVSAEPSRSKRPKILIYAGIGLVVVAVVFVALRMFNKGGVEIDLATVTLTYPSQGNAVLTASGYVVAQQKAAVASKGTGRLVYLGVEEGDKVTKGQVIARLEDQDVLASLAKARADVAVAQADSFDAAQSLERLRKLFASGMASKAELDAAMARFGRVMATIDSYRAGALGAEVALENTRIRAPFDGTVLTKNADVGEIVAPFASSPNSRAAVVSIADMSSVQVEADVSESNITRVSVGQQCEIVLDAYPEKHYRGYVHKIVPTADRSKATVLTKVAFAERDERVLPEMSAKVTFLSSGTKDSVAGSPPKLTLPSSSVKTRDGKQVIFLVRDGVVTETPVRTGTTIGGSIEILEGAAEGDKVVRNPDDRLVSGTKVQSQSR